MIDTLTKQVAEMRIAGSTRTTIATAFGVSVDIVGREITKARTAGLLPLKKPGTFENKIREDAKRHGITRGSVQETLSLLTPEIREWLMSTTPRGSTIAAMVAAIVTDAYHDEQLND